MAHTRYLLLFSGIVSLLMSAVHGQQSFAWTDPETGIPFQTFFSTAHGFLMSTVFPESTSSTELILQWEVPNTILWAGMTLGLGMNNDLLVLAWPFDGEIMFSPRYTTNYNPPTPYAGPTFSTIAPATYINATHWKWTMRCQNCTSWLGGSMDQTAQVFGWAISTSAGVVTPSDPNTAILVHDDFGLWWHNTSACHDPNYATYLTGSSIPPSWHAENDSRDDGSRWIGTAGVRGPYWAKLPLLTLGTLGMQILWSVEMGYASPYLLSLGLSKSWMSMVFVAGPLSGLIMQPLVGVLSDRCASSWGRRRPYLIGGTVVSTIALLLLGYTKGVASIFGLSDSYRASLTVWLAVFSIYFIDFSVNAVMACSRALLIDTLPKSEQELGSAWAGRMSGLGSIAGFFVGNIKLPDLFPFLGTTQLQVLSALSAVLLILTNGATVLAVRERVLVEDKSIRRPGSSSSLGLFSTVKEIWSNVWTLPYVIMRICIIQFLSWIGWFPVLFYTTLWVSDIYVRSQTTGAPTEDILDAGTRAGNRALLWSSIVAMAGFVLLPVVVSSPDAEKKASGGKRWWEVELHVATLWAISNAVFAMSMGATCHSFEGYTLAHGADDEDIPLRDRRTERTPDSLPFDGTPLSSGLPSPNPALSARASRTNLTDDGEDDFEFVGSNGNGVVNDAEGRRLAPRRPNGGEDVGDKAGVILGIHNVFVVIPQFLVTGLSAIVFAIAEPAAPSTSPTPISSELGNKTVPSLLRKSAVQDAENDSRPGSSRWIGTAGVRGPSWARMPLLNLGTAGIQILGSVQMGYASPYLLSLGLSKSGMSMVFVAGPLSGLIMQPLIGVLSDKCTSSWGRRRPFLVGGTMLSMLALLLLGYTKGVASIFGLSDSHTASLTVWLAVFSIYFIDFSLNAVMACSRALLIDTLPKSEQELGSAWAGRMSSLGSIQAEYQVLTALFFDSIHSFRGNIKLPDLLPLLGTTQLQILSALASVLMVVTNGATVLAVRERVLVEDKSIQRAGPSMLSSLGLFSTVKEIWSNIWTLPYVIMRICIIQFLSWIAWFPLLFYTTLWVSDIYVRSQTTGTPTEGILDAGTRAGNRALLGSSVVSMVGFVVLPLMVSTSHAEKKTSGRRRWWELEMHVATLWAISNTVLAMSLISTWFTNSIWAANIVIGATGFSSAVSGWAPFALLGEHIHSSTNHSSEGYTLAYEIDDEDIPLQDKRTERTSDSLALNGTPLSSGLPRPNPALSARASRSNLTGDGEEDFDLDSSNGNRVVDEAESKGFPDLTKTGDDVGDKAGGIHNIFVVIPQFLVTGLSAVVFAIADSAAPISPHVPGSRNSENKPVLLRRIAAQGSTSTNDGFDSIGFMFRLGGLCAGIAAMLCWRLSKYLQKR
ncbi:hypothetical protein DL93DRAFT_2171488 [Clavulina sp. PMI_390]|nr:hypothetical protein DL93DRAFT_2171488 [Clavulina sp. PMI_390]